MHADTPRCTATLGRKDCILEANHPGAQENTGHQFRALRATSAPPTAAVEDDEPPYATGARSIPLVPSPPKEAVNSPAHYNAGNIEVIEAIQDWGLGFCEGNVVKYVARAKHKGKELEDLRKSSWYLDYRISELEQQEAARKPGYREESGND